MVYSEFCLLHSIDWKEIMLISSNIASICIAFCAVKALNTWRKQLWVEKKITFLDQLTDTIHEYIQSMIDCLDYLKLIKIGVDSYIESVHPNDKRKNAGIIDYIEKQGKEQSQKLMEYINSARPALCKMNSLNLKGHTLNMEKYDTCDEVCSSLINIYKQCEAIAGLLAFRNSYWENKQIQEILEDLKDFDVEKLEVDINKTHKIFIKFVKKKYSLLS